VAKVLRVAVWSCFWAAFGRVAPAFAQPPEAPELEWTAPGGCPDRAAVLAEVRQLLGADAKSWPIPPARGVLSREDAGWNLHLEIASGEGVGARDLQDESCLRLAQVAALALALSIEPPSGTPARAPVPAPLAAPYFLVRAIFGGDLGSLRAPSPGPGFAVGVSFGRSRLEAAANYWFPGGAEGGRDQLISGGLHGCLALSQMPEVGFCAAVEGGRMDGDLGNGKRTVNAWLAVLAGGAVGIDLGRWLALRLEVTLGSTLIAPTFDAEDARAAPVFGRLALGVEAHVR
jgi:hypothetical protein